MGYYTSFNMSISPANPERLAEIIEADEILRYALDSDGNSADCVKWYEWQTDMKKLSLQHPDLVFHLTGDGEENGDLWEADFWQGEMQLRPVELVYPPFDPTFGGKRWWAGNLLGAKLSSSTTTSGAMAEANILGLG